MSIIIDKHVKMLCFKFNQNRTINENFTLTPFKKLNLNYYGKHMQVFCFKFQQNNTIKEEFDFFKGEGEEGPPGGEGSPNHKFLS